jgi:crotonobetainyl-CoA:carnitine CoA-transferase CaiB-like acyl-CoA transferase
MLGPVPGPLESWRVVDLADLRGALCGRILADLGADVIRLDPDAPDRAGAAAGPAVHETAAAAYRHANKRTLRYTSAADLHDLLDRADVLVENLRPGRRAELGLEPAAVAEAHPHLIHVVMADFGLTGPRAGWRLEPLTAQAAGGTLFASGFPELPPCSFPGFLGHDCASVYGVIGAVAALADRRRHGRGQTVEVSVQEATLAGTVPWSVAMADYLKINPFLPAEGKRNADGFYWVLPAADGWVRFVIGNEKQWGGALGLAGEPEALKSDEWLDPLFRRMNADAARLVISERLRDRTRAELFDQARRVGATLGVVHLPSEYVAHEQPRSRGVFSEGRLPGFEGAPVVRPPLRFSATPDRAEAGPERPAPAGAWPARAGSATAGDPDGRADSAGPLLGGIRVVEFGMAAVGPEVSLVLSSFGADVIKVESETHLDVLRQAGFGRVNAAFSFNTECRGRRSVALNLDTVRGRALAFELCTRADVVVENYRGGVLEGMGLGYEAVKTANPSVVYASSQGYGSTGPLAGMAAYGPLNFGFSGLHLLWNHAGAPYPCGTSLNHPDHVAGKFLAAAVVAALDHRARTGQGQRVELAQTEFAAFLCGDVYIDGWRWGDPGPVGNDGATASPHGVFPAAGEDRWVAIVAAGDTEWAALCQVAGWPADPALGTLAGRLDRAAEITARVADWTAGQDAAELSARLQAAGVSACPVMGPLEHLEDEHLGARGFIVELQHPEVGAERHEGDPVRMSATAQRTPGPAPCLGVDTVDVLGEVLGLAPAEVERLVAEKICY